MITPATTSKPTGAPQSGIGGGTIGGGLKNRATLNKREELKAKQEELEKQRNLRKTGATPRTNLTKKASDATGRQSARGDPNPLANSGRTSIKGGAPSTAAPARMTLAERTAKAAAEAKVKADAIRAAKAEEKEKTDAKSFMARKPAMSTPAGAPGLRRQASRSRSNVRNELKVPGFGANQPPVSPRGTNSGKPGTAGLKAPTRAAGPQIKTATGGSRLATAGSGISAKTPSTPGAGASPAEIKKWES